MYYTLSVIVLIAVSSFPPLPISVPGATTRGPTAPRPRAVLTTQSDQSLPAAPPLPESLLPDTLVMERTPGPPWIQKGLEKVRDCVTRSMQLRSSSSGALDPHAAPVP